MEFYLQENNFGDQCVILIFEINLIMSLHLREYHLYHDFTECGGKFIEMVQRIIKNYPYFMEN